MIRTAARRRGRTPTAAWPALALRAFLALAPLGVLLAGPVEVLAAQPAEAGEVAVGGFWIDRYEYPNIAGQLPRVDVTWEAARQLCEARGKRLCTESEWEQACRGPGGDVYGYGPEFEPRRCNTPYQEEGRWIRDHGTAVSGAFKACGNDYGVRDMIGNVWEWTAGWYDRHRGWHVVRGGSWFHSVNFARADARYGRFLTSDYHLDLIGFRCCRSGEDRQRPPASAGSD